jgi:hypothetical protein
LSVRKIRHAKPGRHGDGNDGRRLDFGLGTAVTAIINIDVLIQYRRSLTLSQAREKARLARELVKAGMDPSLLSRPKEEKVPSFNEVAAEYHAHVSKGRRNGNRVLTCSRHV